MKKFIKRLIIFLIPILILFILLEYAIRQIPNTYKYKNEWMATLLMPAGITSEASIRYKDEARLLDGAGDMRIYWNIALPLSKAGLATVGLFIALNYWNDWYNAMLFLDEGRRDMYPLQYFLNNILTKAQAMNVAAARSGIPASDVPSEPMKLAMTVVATGPIILLYPFLQKYFVKGVTIGAVKG